MTAPILPEPPRVTRLDPEQITPTLTQALRAGAVLAPAEVAVLALVGPGAVSCFQGLLTNDVEKAGDGAFVYGALLTPKGMIVVDGWAARQGAEVAFTVPAVGRERTAGIFQKSVPPRLAHLQDRTADTVVLRLGGMRALAIAAHRAWSYAGVYADGSTTCTCISPRRDRRAGRCAGRPTRCAHHPAPEPSRAVRAPARGATSARRALARAAGLGRG